MSTATSPTALDRGTAAAAMNSAALKAEEDPRTRRFVIIPAISPLEVHPRESGRSEGVIPYGYAVRVDTFPGMRVPRWDVDPESNAPPDTSVDLTAREAVSNILRAAWQSSRDMGARELSALTPLADEDAYKMLAALMPELDPKFCAYPEQNTRKVRFEYRELQGDEYVTRAREVEMFRCLDCTLGWLKSDACKAEAAKFGRGEELRLQLLAAYQTNGDFFRAKWSEWTAEMQARANGERGLSSLNDSHLHVMRQIHETAPADKQAKAITENQQAQADTILAGFREMGQTLRDELRPQAPAVDVEDIIRQAEERAYARLRAEREQEPDRKQGGDKVKAK